MLASVSAAKIGGKKIEGHFPGASERTLARMRLLGTDGDHEAMTVEEVEARLLHGYGSDSSPFVHSSRSSTFIERHC